MRWTSMTATLSRNIVAVLAVAAILATPAGVQAQAKKTAQGAWGGKTNGAGHYADVNGIRLYYEIHGKGRPLVLLHGGLGAIEMFGPNLPVLAKGRQLIAVDLQGHGRTADIDRPLSVELMADDIAALIKHLGIDSADVMGYSLGGGVALQTAIRHPEVVRKLVVVSTPFRRNAFYPDILAQQGQVTAAAAKQMKQTPMYQLYASIAPRPDDWARLLGKIGDAMKVDFDFSQQIAGIKATPFFSRSPGNSLTTGRDVTGGRKTNDGRRTCDRMTCTPLTFSCVVDGFSTRHSSLLHRLHYAPQLQFSLICCCCDSPPG